MKLNLQDKDWKEFIFDEIFEIVSTSSGIDKNKVISKQGLIPYITRSDKHNGYDSFICEQDSKYKTDEANVITIGLDTQTVFYQPSKFYTGQNIQVLRFEELNYEIAQFLIPLIKNQMEKFSWGGNGATLTRLRRSKLVLPVNQKGEPDFEFMEAFMKEIEKERLVDYEFFIIKRLKELVTLEPVVSLSEKSWSEFEIGKLFGLSQGKSKGLNHLIKTKSGINYLGATNINNGVLCQVNHNDKLTHKGNGIAFIRNGEGSMGYSIYKIEDFIATSDISVGYNENLNRGVGLFITTVADKVRGKYNFGYKRSAARLKKERIMLPVNDKNEPDYEYMENYMKQIEYKKIKEYLEFKGLTKLL